MPQTRILWLTDLNGLSDKTKFSLNFILQKEGLSLSQIYFVCVRANAGVNPGIVQMQDSLDNYIKTFKPKIIVCNDETTLSCFIGKKANLFLSRGSVYRWRNIPVLCIDQPANWHNVWVNQSGKKMHVPGKWVLTNDIQKLARWVNGKQRRQPRFTYKVCWSIHDLAEAETFARSCITIARDIETHPGKITVDGFAGLTEDGTCKAFVIPLYNPFKPGNCHWATAEDEHYAWETIRRINETSAVKVLQNGQYDASYYIKYNCPLNNYTIDVLHLFHSIWTEAPKKLNFISSIMLDFCRYWKDESKGEGKRAGEHSGKFKNLEALERYWRYNALDCYNTLCNARVLVSIISKLPWARKNYAMEFSQQIGPALAMSMRGLRVDLDRIAHKKKELTEKKDKALRDLRIMCDDPDFNPNSPPQVSHLIYKMLGAPMPKMRGKAAEKLKAGTTDANILDLIAEKHPLYEAYIKKIYETKESQNNISKYCDKFYPDRRLYYNLSAAGTETGRYSGKKHSFSIGTNPQNVPHTMRDFVVADEGYVFFEPDYSQSDARFVAYESQDPKYIANVESGKDTHCLHAAHFFRPRTYEEILEGYKNGVAFYADNVTGVRAVTKKIVHGKNYNMGGFTLFVLMGRKATIAAAKAKGFKDAHNWEDERLWSFCQSLLDDYDKLYPRLKPWQKEEMEKGRKDGNKIACAYGRTRLFFGDLSADKQTQREAIAYFGQGGTAGNINRVLYDIYYKYNEFDKAVKLMTQTHDSILFQLPIDNFHYYAKEILTIMAEPCTIHGRQFRVPTDAKIGLSWTIGCVKYTPDITLEKLIAEQQKINNNYARLKDAA